MKSTIILWFGSNNGIRKDAAGLNTIFVTFGIALGHRFRAFGISLDYKIAKFSIYLCQK